MYKAVEAAAAVQGCWYIVAMYSVLPGFSQNVGGVVIFREEFPTTSKFLYSTYSQIKGDCSLKLKALKFNLSPESILGRTLM